MTRITKQRGPAGQYSLTAETPDGPLTFVSSEYGAPIVMVLPSGAQTFVTDPGRFGSRLDEQWIENFLTS